jgi:hypothetical protein
MPAAPSSSSCAPAPRRSQRASPVSRVLEHAVHRPPACPRSAGSWPRSGYSAASDTARPRMRGSGSSSVSRKRRSRMAPRVDSPVRKRHADNPRPGHLDRVLEAPFLPLAIASTPSAGAAHRGGSDPRVGRPDTRRRSAKSRLTGAIMPICAAPTRPVNGRRSVPMFGVPAYPDQLLVSRRAAEPAIEREYEPRPEASRPDVVLSRTLPPLGRWTASPTVSTSAHARPAARPPGGTTCAIRR